MTSTQPAITLIIPCYNVAAYVQATLDSVSAQTATFGGALECLLIDDGSTDHTASVCQAYLEAYAGSISYRLLRQPRNLGVSAARNRGIREATGRYLYFMDGDDTLVPDCLAALWACVEQHPGVEMVYAGIRRTDGDPWMSYEGRHLPAYTTDRHAIKIDLIGSEHLTVSCCNKLYRRELIVGNQLYFDETLPKHEDDLWNNLLAKYVTSLATVARDTYIYNVHSGSLTTTHDDDIKCMMDRLVVEERIIRHIDDLYRDDQIRRVLFQSFHYYLSTDHRAVRRRIGQQHRLLARQCGLRRRLVLYLLSLLAWLDRGDGSPAFRLYRRLRHYAFR